MRRTSSKTPRTSTKTPRTSTKTPRSNSKTLKNRDSSLFTQKMHPKSEVVGTWYAPEDINKIQEWKTYELDNVPNSEISGVPRGMSRLGQTAVYNRDGRTVKIVKATGKRNKGLNTIQWKTRSPLMTVKVNEAWLKKLLRSPSSLQVGDRVTVYDKLWDKDCPCTITADVDKDGNFEVTYDKKWSFFSQKKEVKKVNAKLCHRVDYTELENLRRQRFNRHLDIKFDPEEGRLRVYCKKNLTKKQYAEVPSYLEQFVSYYTKHN